MLDDAVPTRSRLSRAWSAVARQSLLRNSVWIMLTTAVNSLLGYAFWLVVARMYRPSEVGLAGALIATMSLLAAIMNLGTSAALVQRLPTLRSDSEWSRTLTASTVTATAGGFVLAVLAAVVVVPAVTSRLDVISSSVLHTAIFVSGVVLWSLSVVADYLFIAERRAENMFLRNLVFGLAKLAAVVVVAETGGRTATGVFGAWVGASALALVLAFFLLLPRLAHRYRPSKAGVTREIRAMARSYAGNYLVSLGNQLGVFLLPVVVVTRLSASANAYFYVAWLLAGAFLIISSSVGSALFAEGTHDPASLPRQTRSSIRITAALLGPAMVLFFAAGGWVLGLFGTEYSHHATTLLVVLTTAAVPDAITNLYVGRQRAEGRLRLPAVMTLCAAAVTVASAWLLLPSMGLTGAGVAWLSGQSVGTLICLADALRRRRLRRRLVPAT